MDAHAFLAALAVVLCTAAVTTVVFQWLRQPVVLGYLLAGLIVGPILPIPLVADPRIVSALSELGVILLMFSLGLEFSLAKLRKIGPTAGVTALLECSVMVSLGFLVGSVLGWSTTESIFAGALVAISSTTIIAKAFAENSVSGRLRELVVGVLVVEDMIAILLMAILTTISSGAGLSAMGLALTVGKLAGFLVGVMVVGLLIVPPAMRAIVKLGRNETIVVASVGLCFAVALLAQELGYSVALGAFLAGSLVAESGVGHEVETRVEPVRDVFAAVFFVAVGMLIDPHVVVDHWLAVVLLTAIVIVGKSVSVSVGAFLTGNGITTSVRAGMSMSQIGEFSFIIAGLGVALGATDNHLYPIAVAVSALTTLSTPWMIRASGPVAGWIDRALPPRIQTFASLYGNWIERLGATSPEDPQRKAGKRLAMWLALDAALIISTIIGTSLLLKPAVAWAGDTLLLSSTVATALVIAIAVLVASPFLIGIARMTRQLGNSLANLALPSANGTDVDLSAAPRRAMILVLELAVLGAVGLPIVALTLPFVPHGGVVAVLLVLLGVLGLAFWRRANDLQGHVRAGAAVIMEALGAQIRRGANSSRIDNEAGNPADVQLSAEESLAQLSGLMHGLGDPIVHHLPSGAHALGRTLAQVNLRGATGATVLAIAREGGAFVPGPTEKLASGDVLALAGRNDAVARAIALLDHGIAPDAD